MMFSRRFSFQFQRLFPGLILNIPGNGRKVYLTFDDGPTPVLTDWVLSVLKENKAKATFFCKGRNVEEFQHTYQKIIEAGHSVGNHGYDHLNGWKTSSGKYLSDVSKAAFSIKSNLFRPPYGKVTLRQFRELRKKYRIIIWDILTRDYSHLIDPENCLRKIRENVREGSIIVFHDSLKAENNLRQVLPEAIIHLKESGFELCSIK